MSLGADLARAIVARDHARVRDLLHPEIDFRAMTPNFVWEDLLDALPQWIEVDEQIELDQLDEGSYADRERVGFRYRLRRPDGEFLVEQQFYLSERDGRIGWLRIMCGGPRPV